MRPEIVRQRVGEEMSRLYKGHYLIALYDREDDLIAVLDNARQMAEWLEMDQERVWTLLWYAWEGTRKYLIHRGRRCYIYFIDMEEEE